MAIPQTQCPECREVVASEAGFSSGQTVLCPKCETYFTAAPLGSVAARKQPGRPARAESGPRPRKKFSIVNAVVAFVLLLIIAGGVYSFVVYRNQEADKRAREQAERDANPAKMNGPISDAPPKKDGKNKDRKTTPNPNKGPSNPAPPPALDLVLGTILPKSPPPSPAEAQRQIDQLRPQLIGTWKSKPGDPTVRTIEYRADGTFRDEVTGPKARVLEGTWEVAGVAGKKGLKLTRSGGSPPVRTVLEGGELIHDADEPGATAVLVKS